MRRILLCVIAVLGLSALAWAGPDSSDPVELTSEFAVSAAVWGCGHCHGCSAGEEDGHDFHDTNPLNLDGEDHPCEEGECDEDDCPIPAPSDSEREDLELELLLVADGDVEALMSILQSHANQVSVMPSRSVLQVSGSCSPEYLVAQVPLTDAQLQVAAAAATSTSSSF